MKPNPPPKLFTPDEASDLLSVSTRTLRRAVRRNELAVIRFNARVIRFTETDLAAWFASRRVSATRHKVSQPSVEN